jgi:hypothetical protein
VCAKCHQMFDGSQPGTMKEVKGWEVVRSGGGANQIRMREETGMVVCPPCASNVRYDRNANQTALFE